VAIGISLVKLCVDASALIAAIRRRLARLCADAENACNAASAVDEQMTTAAQDDLGCVGVDGALAVRSACAIDGSQLVWETPATLDWRLSDDDDGFDAPAAPHDYDHLFWDVSGHAIVRSNETEDDTVTQRQSFSQEGALVGWS
jgi:hypothetical protein